MKKNVLFGLLITVIFPAYSDHKVVEITHQPSKHRLFWHNVICTTNEKGLPCCRSIYEHALHNPAFDDIELIRFKKVQWQGLKFDTLTKIGTYGDPDARQQLLKGTTTHGCLWCPEESGKGFFLFGTKDTNLCQQCKSK